MTRFAAFALPLALLANPALAQTTAPAPVKPAMPKVDKPSDLGCMIRMMDLFLLTRKAGEDQARTAEERQRSSTLSMQANSATMYYAGRLGPDFSKTNRAADGAKEFTKMRGNTREVTAAEMAMCMTEAEAGQRAILQSMSSPKTTTK